MFLNLSYGKQPQVGQNLAALKKNAAPKYEEIYDMLN